MKFSIRILLLSLVIALTSASTAPASSVEDVCRKIGGKLGSVSYGECMERSLALSGHASVEDVPILFKEYPPLPSRTPSARVLLLGGIHGDEYSAVSIVFKWMEILDRYHSGLFHWKVVPLLNPDGLLRSRSRRGNANNVDLNRNFLPLEGPESSLHYWEERTRKDPRRFPGPTPLSEPETRFVHELIASFRPDVIIAVHAPYGIIDFDGPPHPPEKLGHLHLRLLGTYPGSLGNYAGLQLGIPVLTIELPSAGIMPVSHEISAIWVDLVRYLSRENRTVLSEAQGDDQPPQGEVPRSTSHVPRLTAEGI